MKSLRQTLETSFAAAAFAERGLPQDARTLMGQKSETQDKKSDKRPGQRSDRPRPTPKA